MSAPRPTAVSSVYGKIKEVLVVMEGLPSDNMTNHYGPILNHFKEEGTAYQFAIDVPQLKVPKAEKPKEVFRTYVPQGSTPTARVTYRDLQTLTPQTNLSRLVKMWGKEIEELQAEDRKLDTVIFRKWVQDPFVVLEWQGATLLLHSMRHQQICDFFLPLELSSQIRSQKDRMFLVQPSLLYLEGGNILIGEDKAFVGKDIIQQNIEKRKEHGEEITEVNVRAELKRELGVSELVMVGTRRRRRRLPSNGFRGGSRRTAQPYFHIDLFMTLGGKTPEGKEIIFLGDPQFGKELLMPQAQLYRLPDREYESAVQFQEVRECFPDDKYQIVDLPLYVTDLCVYSWNNVLIEVYDDCRRVFVPSYQVPPSKQDREGLNATFRTLESEVQRIYEAQGFEVVWLPNGEFFRILARAGGSLHCITKVIRRE